MHEQTRPTVRGPRDDTSSPVREGPRIPVIALGMSLGTFLAITYTLCVLFDLWLPEQAMYESWQRLLPGFIWIDWASFFIGLGETFAYGWYVALVFAPLFNVLAARRT